MSLSVEKLTKYSIELQKQFETASAMMHQAAGALNFVRRQINDLNYPQKEPENEQTNGEIQKQAS